METNKRGKLIYQPLGAAAEYAKWACNLYNGCSNKCEYCYNRHSQGAKLLGKDEPTIKGGMSDEEAYELFKKEFAKYMDDIVRKDGLFFSFVSDPCLPETIELNFRCIEWCVCNLVPVIILTKRVDFLHYDKWNRLIEKIVSRNNLTHLIYFGFTLTGCDELEPNASTNEQRIEAMAYLRELGFLTWASMEPIIDLKKSYEMFKKAIPYCYEFRFGLNRLKKDYTKEEIREFISRVEEESKDYYCRHIVWKESVRKFIE